MPERCSNCDLMLKFIHRHVNRGEILPPGYSLSCPRCKSVMIVSNSGPGYAATIGTDQKSYDSTIEFIQKMEREELEEN